MIDLNRVLTVFLALLCMGMGAADVLSQNVYRARYDADTETLAYDVQVEGQWKSLKRPPYLLTEDLIEVSIQNLNPRAVEAQVVVEGSSVGVGQAGLGILANSLEMASSRQVLAGNILSTPASLTPSLSPVELSTTSPTDLLMGLPLSPATGLMKMSEQVFKLGWGSRGVPTDAPQFEEVEDPNVVKELEQRADEMRKLLDDLNNEMAQTKSFEATGAPEASRDEMQQLRLQMSRLESRMIVDEQFREDLNDARTNLDMLRRRYPLESIRTQLVRVDRLQQDMLRLDERAFDGTSELSEALSEIQELSNNYFPDGLNVPSEFEVQTNRMVAVLEELEGATFEVKSTLSPGAVREGGVLLGIVLKDIRDHSTLSHEMGRRLTWYFQDTNDSKGDPMLQWEGFTTGGANAIAAQAMSLPGACGTWRQYNKEGQLVGLFDLGPCHDVGGTPVETKHLRLGSPKAWRSFAGLAVSVLRPIRPLEAYRIALPDEWTYVIESNEVHGVSPAIGTSLGYEKATRGHISTGLALGVSYGLEQNSNLHLSFGPTLRLKALPELMLTGGVALSRIARLDPNYEVGVVYQRDPAFALEIPLVNRFDPSLFISLIFRSN